MTLLMTAEKCCEALDDRHQTLMVAMSGLKRKGLVVKSFSVNAATANPEVVLAFAPAKGQLPTKAKILNESVCGDAKGERTKHQTAMYLGCRVRWQEDV